MSKPYIVYRTENKANGKFYYGVHNNNSPYYIGSGSVLKDAVRKYGRDNFVRRTIKEFETAEEAYNFESIMVDETLINDRNCYNVKLGGSSGWTHSEETKLKLSESNTGHTVSEDTKEKISKANLGRDVHWIKKRVLCIEDDLIFDSITDAAKYYGAYSASTIRGAILRKGTYKKKHYEWN